VENKLRNFLALVALLWSARAYTAEENSHLSAKAIAFAPNAGGQEAYTLAYENKNREYFLFANKSLSAGEKPLIGGGYSFRFPICDENCFWQFYVQLGGGLSTGGPFGEVLWGAMIPIVPIWLPMKAPKYVPNLRIDFANQFYASKHRAITWSYPLWLGISIPF